MEGETFILKARLDETMQIPDGHQDDKVLASWPTRNKIEDNPGRYHIDAGRYSIMGGGPGLAPDLIA